MNATNHGGTFPEWSMRAIGVAATGPTLAFILGCSASAQASGTSLAQPGASTAAAVSKTEATSSIATSPKTKASPRDPAAPSVSIAPAKTGGNAVPTETAERPVQGGAEELKKALADMLADGRDVMSGKSADAAVGVFVIVIQKLPSNDPRAMSKARQDAMKRIGEYLGANVEAKTESGYKEATDKDGKSMSESFFRDYSAVSVNTALGAVETLGAVKVGDRDALAFVLSEGAASRMQSLSEQSMASLKAKESGKPLEVDSIGFSRIEGGDVATAKQRAVQQAQRFAIEAAMGATVVGMTVKDADDADYETFRETCVTNSDGQIASFATVEEGTEGENYRVKIRAVVQQGKLLDSYRAHLRSMGDPLFVVDAGGDGVLQDLAVDFFEEKGFRVVSGSEGKRGDWRIVLKAKISDQPDPADPNRTGKQCVIDARLENASTGEINMQAGSKGKGFSSMDGDAERRARKATELAFNRMKRDLHENIDKAIMRLAREGRPITITVKGVDATPDAGTRLLERIQLRPGLNDAKVRVADGTLVIELKATVASDLVATFVAGDACALSSGSRPTVERMDDRQIELRISRGGQS
jgi:hypothetical protein